MTDRARRPTLLVRADAGHAVGYGHLLRSATIGRALQDLAGWPWRYAALPGGDAGPARRRRSEIVALPDRSIDALMSVHAPGDGPVLLDGYDLDAADLCALRRAGYCTITIDDRCDKGWYPADIVVDGAPGAEAEDYRGPRDTTFCLGAEYCLLRSEFRAARDRGGGPMPGGRRLAITMGGSDPDDQTARLVTLCERHLHRTRLEVVLGPGYRGAASTAAPERTEIVRAPADLAERFADAQIAICSAGGTACEMAYLGVPTILIALADNQRTIAAALARAGAAIDLGDHRALRDDDLLAAARSLLRDPARRARMRAAGRRLIDGRGPRRVARAIVARWEGRCLGPPAGDVTVGAGGDVVRAGAAP